MSDRSSHFRVIRARIERRQQLLDSGLGLSTLDGYNMLTLQIAEAAPQLLRALDDVIDLRDELAANEGPIEAVARSFAAEIDRALKGHRSRQQEGDD